MDAVIPGCPPNRRRYWRSVKTSRSASRKLYTIPVCIECRRRGNVCLLDLNKPCLGPSPRRLLRVCASGGFECWGCRGQTADANLPTFAKMLKGKGFKREFIEERMRTFVGLKIPARKEVMAE